MTKHIIVVKSYTGGFKRQFLITSWIPDLKNSLILYYFLSDFCKLFLKITQEPNKSSFRNQNLSRLCWDLGILGFGMELCLGVTIVSCFRWAVGVEVKLSNPSMEHNS